MKKKNWALLPVILLIAVMIGGCAAKQVPSSPGKTEAPKETATEQTFELVYSDWGPEQIDVGQAAVRAIKRITGSNAQLFFFIFFPLFNNIFFTKQQKF